MGPNRPGRDADQPPPRYTAAQQQPAPNAHTVPAGNGVHHVSPMLHVVAPLHTDRIKALLALQDALREISGATSMLTEEEGWPVLLVSYRGRERTVMCQYLTGLGSWWFVTPSSAFGEARGIAPSTKPVTAAREITDEMQRR